MNRRQLFSTSLAGVAGMLIPRQLSATRKPPSFELIEPPEGFASIFPRGINNNGDISGFTYPQNGITYGFIKRGDQFTLLTPPGSVATRAHGIDNEGRVVGHFFDSNEQFTRPKAFIYQEGQYTVFGPAGTMPTGVSEGRVVGSFQDGEFQRGFLYSNGVFTQIDYPGSLSTALNGINSEGKIVGRSVGNGFVYQNGQFEAVTSPVLGAPDTTLFDLNHDSILGSVGGICEWGPFLLRRDRFMLLDLPGVNAYGINDAGQIVGDYGREKGFVADVRSFLPRGNRRGPALSPLLDPLGGVQ